MIGKSCVVLQLTEKGIKGQTSTYEAFYKSYEHLLGECQLNHSRKNMSRNL